MSSRATSKIKVTGCCLSLLIYYFSHLQLGNATTNRTRSFEFSTLMSKILTKIGVLGTFGLRRRL